MKNWYAVLEVSESASPEVIRAAWRLLQRKYHPDKPGGNEEQSKLINIAFDVLSDPDRRAAFDAELQRTREAEHGPQYQRPGWPADFGLNPDAYPNAYQSGGEIDLGAVARDVLFDASLEIGGAFLNNVMHQMSPLARQYFLDAIARRRKNQEKKTGS